MSIGSGIYRKVDILGRVTIPKELRNGMGIEPNHTYLEITKTGENEITLGRPKFNPKNIGKHANLNGVNVYKCFCGCKCDTSMDRCYDCGSFLYWD